MCKLLYNLFKPKPVIPHPELPASSESPIGKTIEDMVDNWFFGWGVPTKYWEYWENTFVPASEYPYPDAVPIDDNGRELWGSWSWEDRTYVTTWYRFPEVCAYEAPHKTRSILTDKHKNEWWDLFNTLKKSNALLKELCKQYYWRPWLEPVNNGEQVGSYAGVYRYLGHEMPEELKRYYPNLI